MNSDDLLAARDQFLVLRQNHQDAIVTLDTGIQAADHLIGVLEALGTHDPNLAVPPASAPTGPASKTTRTKSADHRAVKALRSVDYRPYQDCTKIKELAVAYARRHDGVIHMAELVALAVRLRLSKAALYKNSWGAVYKSLRRDPAFGPCKDGMIVVDEALLRPRSDKAP